MTGGSRPPGSISASWGRSIPRFPPTIRRSIWPSGVQPRRIMPAYGIDTSIFVRVLTGLPAADYQATLKRLAAIRASQPEHITVANIVIAEAYAVLQHHYALGKSD